ncbi:pyridoxamine 5'-phosphate oxidase family protein [Falsiroseomonas tokyonensis]|uniref:Pyridoxamine 5'-phosphate oxidase family protein n=1 Tax=Falsiroseomonas tokyonensis TaxID=430521 RepID=A0ABV7C0Y8_9PROT|nr:pyridoxamine 5'-phosphate oxidase family protein [Falsiroseomonas tokyonensis]MBU8540135.1 pyridoxamine 5'-phosphate oxidase family protein [Falsiroseomonas tokyonensis]
MATWTIEDLAKAMGRIDFTMLTTRTEGGALATRPMSNNGEVEYRGDSFYFSWDSARLVRDIEADPMVGLSFQGQSIAGLLGKPPLFVAVQGKGRIIRDRAAFAEHWSEDLDRWFPQGIETPGVAMIHVRATRIHYWDGEDQGEITP